MTISQIYRLLQIYITGMILDCLLDTHTHTHTHTHIYIYIYIYILLYSSLLYFSILMIRNYGSVTYDADVVSFIYVFEYATVCNILKYLPDFSIYM